MYIYANHLFCIFKIRQFEIKPIKPPIAWDHKFTKKRFIYKVNFKFNVLIF